MKYLKGWGNKVKLAVNVDWELKAKLYQMAANQGATLSEFVQGILEKQIPRDCAIEQNFTECHDTFYCPNCGSEIGEDYLGMMHIDLYCRKCGQAIDKELTLEHRI